MTYNSLHNFISDSLARAMKSKKSYHLKPNKIYNLAAELQEQGKQIRLCKIKYHKGITGDGKADKSDKEATTMLPLYHR